MCKRAIFTVSIVFLLLNISISRSEARGAAPGVKEYHVDVVNGDDANDGLTRETAFADIQQGIDAAANGDTLLVWPGVYKGFNFEGKAVTVKSAADAAVIEGGIGIWLDKGEGADSVLKNFVIRDCMVGVLCINGSPTLHNLTVVDCDYGVMAYAPSAPEISNCIFWNNRMGDLYGCDSEYSFFQKDWEGLVSWWKFNEADGDIAYDSVGSNHGAVHGAARIDGNIQGALQFDGIDDFVDLGKDSSLDFNQAFTISTWVKPRGKIGEHQRFIARGYYNNENNSESFDLRYVYDTNEFGYRIRHDYNIKLITAPAQRNVWQHVVSTYDHGVMKLYVNGKHINSATGANLPPGVSDYNLWAAKVVGTSVAFFNGDLDDIMYFNRALLADEVQQLYQNDLVFPRFADADNDDYHLKSKRGRFVPLTLGSEQGYWILDEATSPGVDAGDPMIFPMNEPMPNGARINLGAYGGTAYASMSEWPRPADVNRDGVINLADFALLVNDWLWRAPWKQ